MLFSIHYVDENGSQQVLNSGEGWICDGQPAIIQGKHGVAPWGLFSQIQSDAVWIWSNSVTTCTCTFTFPKPAPVNEC
jgi:hypothetical protein